MRVAFDAAPLLDPPTGVGRYARELARALTLRGIDVVPFAVSLRGKKDENVRRWRLPARHLRAVWRRWDAPKIERFVGAVDIVHATNFVLPPTRAAGVVTVHDLSFMRDDTWPGGERLRDLVPWSLARAAHVVTPTRAVAAEVSEAFRFPDDRIAVTHEGVAPGFFGATPLGPQALQALGIEPPFILAVGTLEPRKNLPRLLAAWRSVRARLDGWTLVLAGPRGWGPELPAVPGVVLPGWVGDETLPGLLAAAEVFAYVSLYEGFGLPPLEAMATGTPTIVADYGAASEVVGDAALVVSGADVEAIADGLERVAGDGSLRRRLSRAGRARASMFSWDATAAATAAVYDAVTT